jgi:hypothetical protein
MGLSLHFTCSKLATSYRRVFNLPTARVQVKCDILSSDRRKTSLYRVWNFLVLPDRRKLCYTKLHEILPQNERVSGKVFPRTLKRGFILIK